MCSMLVALACSELQTKLEVEYKSKHLMGMCLFMS